jgi:hypothetical protein
MRLLVVECVMMDGLLLMMVPLLKTPMTTRLLMMIGQISMMKGTLLKMRNKI